MPPRGSGKAKAKLLPLGPLAKAAPLATRRLREKSPLPGASTAMLSGADSSLLGSIQVGCYLEGRWREFYGSGGGRFLLEITGGARDDGGRIFPCRLVAGSTKEVREECAAIMEKRGSTGELLIHVCATPAEVPCPTWLPGRGLRHISNYALWKAGQNLPLWSRGGLPEATGAAPDVHATAGGAVTPPPLASVGRGGGQGDAASRALAAVANAAGFEEVGKWPGPPHWGEPPEPRTPAGLPGDVGHVAALGHKEKEAADKRAGDLRAKLLEAKSRRENELIGLTSGGDAAELSLRSLYEKERRAHKHRKKGHRRRGRKRRRGSSSSCSSRRSSSTGSRTSSASDFRRAPGPLTGGGKAKRTAATRPGKLLRSGLRAMSQFLPQGAGGDHKNVDTNDFTPRVVHYLNTVSEGLGGGMRNVRELRTLAQSLDALLSGNLLLAADTLMQRFKSVELASIDQNWSVAQHLELTPALAVAAVNDGERRAAAKEEFAVKKLDRMSRPGEAGRHGSPPRRRPG